MIRPGPRAVALLVAAPFLVFASALAPQHVHEAGHGPHGHSHAVAHSHFAPHDIVAHHDDDVAEVECDTEHIVWLDGSVLYETPHHAAPVLPAIPLTYALVPAEQAWSVTPFESGKPPHGPPKGGALFRGPPFRLV